MNTSNMFKYTFLIISLIYQCKTENEILPVNTTIAFIEQECLTGLRQYISNEEWYKKNRFHSKEDCEKYCVFGQNEHKKQLIYVMALVKYEQSALLPDCEPKASTLMTFLKKVNKV